MNIKRVVILGHSGFIGSRLLGRLRAERPDLDVRGLSLGEIDLGDPAGADRLGEVMDEGAALVMCAAIKRQLGDTPDIYQRNTQITVTLANALARHRIGRLVYLSSAAVYGEDVENLAIDEATPTVARSYYGLSKITGEWILRQAMGEAPLLCVRPPTLYGPGDMVAAYGPSGFLDAAIHDQPITLWGDGSERREFVYIDDVVRLLCELAVGEQRGVLNLAAGVSYSFLDALEAVRRVVGRLPEVTSRPRSKDKVDNAFDASRLRALFGDMAFTPLEEGLRRTYGARYGAAAGQAA